MGESIKRESGTHSYLPTFPFIFFHVGGNWGGFCLKQLQHFLDRDHQLHFSRLS